MASPNLASEPASLMARSSAEGSPSLIPAIDNECYQNASPFVIGTAYNLGNRLPGMGFGDTVKAKRKARGWSQADLGREVGISQPAVKKIEAGTTKDPRKKLEIARLLEIPLETSAPAHVALTETPNSLVGDRNFPVHAAVEGGNGTMVVSSDPVDYVRRPAPLANVRDGYGIIVIGTSMEPEFRPGDTALIHPHLPETVGETHVFYADDGHGMVLATIKNLVRATVTHWHIQQWNPPKKFTLARKDWQKCHLVVGRYTRRGS